MIVKKVTIGFVIQEFDTMANKFVKQEFIARNEVTFEDEYGKILDDNVIEKNQFPFEMVQPE
jgi:hypothetical protein